MTKVILAAMRLEHAIMSAPMGLRAWLSREREAHLVMPWDEFVRSSLVGISQGRRKASGTLAENNGFLGYTHKTEAGKEPVIEFDVAVTSKAERAGKVGVVGAVGASGSFALARETVSRIKFVVHVKNWLGWRGRRR